jgi:hypothetical protein
VNPILLAAEGTLPMEERRVGVAILEEGNAGSLSRDRALEGGQAQVDHFQLLAQPVLVMRDTFRHALNIYNTVV